MAEICWRVSGTLNRGRHLYSAGRPSRWALAQILVLVYSIFWAFQYSCMHYQNTRNISLLYIFGYISVLFSSVVSGFNELCHIAVEDFCPHTQIPFQRTFTFAICYMLSPVRPSACRLSVVCNVPAPYSGGSNFRQYFYGIRYLGHPLTLNDVMAVSLRYFSEFPCKMLP